MHFSLLSSLFILDSEASWKFLFWISALTIIYTYAGYPALLWLVARFKPAKETVPSTVPYLTFLIAAHNEASNIKSKIEQTLALRYPRERLQILIASDGSSDQTVSIVRSFADKGVDLLVIPQQGGKTNAQNLAVQHAKGDIVVFSDATTEYHPDALQYIAGALADPSVGAVSGRYTYSALPQDASTGGGARAYAGYDNMLRRLQSQIDSITGCCGCIYAIRRSLYTPLEPFIISDLVEPLHVLLQGKKVRFESRAVAREDAVISSGKEFSMRVRVVARALTGLWSVKDLLLPWKHPWIAFQLYSHKLLRYAVPFLLLGSLLASIMLHSHPFYRIVLAAQLALFAACLAAVAVPRLRTIKLFSLPLYFCIVNSAALCAVLQFLRGQRYVIWNPHRESSPAN